jgi:hypothetical protein
MYQSLTNLYEDKITVVSNPQVALSLTADDWGLYDDDTGRYANREAVAVALNDQISNAINASKHRSEALHYCTFILERYSESGAADTWGRDVLYIILKLAYGISEG